ncbi:fibronectin type III domain-containing protein [Candidatus Palauibacter sp.]|uniref:fibronectin type III domain-containing protein n=1 Tax=Candidatus Palauibacter sp. TaxID=3101350 RepID=UPI003B02119F
MLLIGILLALTATKAEPVAIQTQLPGAVSSLEVRGVWFGGGLRVTWDAPPGDPPDDYRVLWRKGPGQRTNEMQAFPRDTGITLRNLEEGQWEVRVRARRFDGGGTPKGGPWSEWTTAPVAAAPTLLQWIGGFTALAMVVLATIGLILRRRASAERGAS